MSEWNTDLLRYILKYVPEAYWTQCLFSRRYRDAYYLHYDQWDRRLHTLRSAGRYRAYHEAIGICGWLKRPIPDWIPTLHPQECVSLNYRLGQIMAKPGGCMAVASPEWIELHCDLQSRTTIGLMIEAIDRWSYSFAERSYLLLKSVIPSIPYYDYLNEDLLVGVRTAIKLIERAEKEHAANQDSQGRSIPVWLLRHPQLLQQRLEHYEHEDVEFPRGVDLDPKPDLTVQIDTIFTHMSNLTMLVTEPFAGWWWYILPKYIADDALRFIWNALVDGSADISVMEDIHQQLPPSELDSDNWVKELEGLIEWYDHWHRPNYSIPAYLNSLPRVSDRVRDEIHGWIVTQESDLYMELLQAAYIRNGWDWPDESLEELEEPLGTPNSTTN